MFTEPTMNSLVIESTSLTNFLAQADANFPFKTPLLIQALDSNSRVITDGPDSVLVRLCSVTVDPLWFNRLQIATGCRIVEKSAMQAYPSTHQ